MAWIALDCALGEHPKMAALPSDAARYGWVMVLLAAKRQARPGRFVSERHFREVLHRHAKSLPHYLAARLIERNEDGSLAVHDWERYQWKAAKARQREETSETIAGQIEDEDETSRARNVVPVPVLQALSGEKGSGEEGDADHLEAWYRLTGSWPSPKVLPWLNELAADHGSGGVSQAMAIEWGEDPNRKDLISRTRDRLEREAHARSLQRRKKDAIADAEYDRRLAESMTDEQRAVNLKRLRDEMAAHGLVRKEGEK